MSLQNVEAQLGNLLSAMPLKLQKVSPTFLDTATPPFEGAMASDAQGQFYVSDFNDQGELSWKQIIDNTARQAAAGESNSEVVLQYDLPVGFESSTITFGKTLTGSQFSAFVQYEPPGGDDMTMYVFAVKNITSTQFDLHVSDTIGEAGGKLHIFAKGYGSSGAGSSGGDVSNDGDSSGGDVEAPTLTSSIPSDGAIDVAIDSDLVLNFSEVVNAESGSITLKLSSDGSVVEAVDVTSGQISGSGTDQITVSFISGAVNATEYYVCIDDTCFDDDAGNSYAGITSPTELNFTTVDAPEVTRQSDLVAWWKMDEASGSVVADSVSSFDGTAVGMTDSNWVPGPSTGHGNCLEFNGVDQYVTIPNSSGLHIAESGSVESFSVSYWYKYPDAEDNAGIIGKASEVFFVGAPSNAPGDDKMRVFNYLMSSSNWTNSSNVELDNSDEWYHVVCTIQFNNGTWTFRNYVNGAMEMEGTTTNSMQVGTGDWTFGNGNGSFGRMFLGDVRFYNATLTDSDVASIYGGGDGDFVSSTEGPASEPAPTLSDIVGMSPEFWWDWGDSYSDASATTPAAGGDLVMSVADQSSNNRILTASNAGYAPELQTGGANGQPYVDSGTHSCRFKWIADADISGPACVYMVMKDYSNANLTFWNNPSSGASFYNVNTDGTAPDVFRTTFGSDGNYGAVVLTPEVKIYQIYASGTEVGIRVNGGAIHPHWAPSETITPVVENFTSAGELMYLPYGAKVQFYEFGFIPDVTHDQDKVFRYLGDKYNIDVTDVS